MKFLKLKYFVDIADCGSVSATARKNFIAQQSMSASLHNLEEYYGVKLFTRTPSFHLTPEGERLYSTAKEVLALMQDFEESLQSEAAPLVLGLSYANTPPFLYDLVEYANTGMSSPIDVLLKTNCDGWGSSATDADVFFGVHPPQGFKSVELIRDRLIVAVARTLFIKTYGDAAAEKEKSVRASRKLDELRDLPFIILTVDNTIPPFMQGVNIASRGNSSDLATNMCLKGKMRRSWRRITRGGTSRRTGRSSFSRWTPGRIV